MLVLYMVSFDKGTNLKVVDWYMVDRSLDKVDWLMVSKMKANYGIADG